MYVFRARCAIPISVFVTYVANSTLQGYTGPQMVAATLPFVNVFVVSHLGDGLLVAIDRIVAPMGVLG